MAAGKSSRINRQYKTKVQNPELEGNTSVASGAAGTSRSG